MSGQTGKANGDGQAGFKEQPPPPNPLDGLIARASAPGGAAEAHQPEVVAALAELRRTDRPSFVTLWNALKKIKGVVISLLHEQMDEADGGGSIDLGAEAETAIEALLRLAAPAELFTSEDETAFADFINVKGHRVTSPIEGKAFKRWLLNQYVKETKRGPSGETLQAALNALDAQAFASETVRPVFARVGHFDGKVYIDRGSPDWSAIEIDRTGWRVVAEPPVRFIRSRSTAELPLPVRGGSIADLSAFLNVDKAGFILSVGWLLGALNPEGPYAVLAVFGQHGAAKTSALRVLRLLIDPNRAAMRSLPPSERDLLVGALQTWVQAYDNLSNLSHDMSDTLCRLSSGSGLVLRAMRTDTDEVLLTAQRPVCLNGIVEVVTRPDLVDRSVFVTALPLAKRRRDREFWKTFDAARPALLGALYDAVACALANTDMAPPDDLPRMADFAEWVTRGEAAFDWSSGTFLFAYRESLELSAQIAVEADLLASALILFMQNIPKVDDAPHGDVANVPRQHWHGSAAALLSKLNTMVGEGQARSKDWPKAPNELGRRLARVIPPLAQLGLSVVSRRSNQKRLVDLKWLATDTVNADAETAAETHAPDPAAEPAPFTETEL